MLTSTATRGRSAVSARNAGWAEDHNLLVDLVIDGEAIRTTPEHPFYTADGEWVAAGLLHVGDWIRQADGGYSQVAGYALVVAPQSMHNLTVRTAHTYFVGVGQWLVHNACFYDLCTW